MDTTSKFIKTDGCVNMMEHTGPAFPPTGATAGPGRVRDVGESLREAIRGLKGARVLSSGDPGAAGAVIPSRPAAQVKD